MEFSFQGRSPTGELIQGSRESTSQDSLIRELHEEGIIIISIQEAKSSKQKGKASISLFKKKVRLDELLMFCRQMYTLTKAGIPIILALNRLSETVTNPEFKNALQKMAEGISGGQTLSTAMQKFPNIFSSMLVELVHVGEESGQLETTFLQAADYLDLQNTTKRRIVAVLRYPAFVIVAIGAAVIVVNLFVIPNFAKLYGSFKVALPLPTRILIGTSNFMVAHWHFLLLSLISTIILLRFYLRSPAGKLFWGQYQLRVPIIGIILKHVLMARFARIFEMILKAGVPLLDSLKLVGGALDNAYAEQRLNAITEAIEHGETLSRAAAAQTGLFPPVVLQMLAVGEETGSLDSMLKELGDFYEREADFEIKRLSDKIEPILIIAIAGMVLILALGIFLPMWDMTKLIQKS